MEGLEDRLRTLEAQLTSLERQGGSGPRTDMSEDILEQANDTLLTNANVIPQVRECSLAEFKNRIAGTKDGRYAVEVLTSGRLLDSEIREEQRIREKRSTKTDSKKQKASVKAENKKNAASFSDAQAEEKWIQSVRLQSPALLKIFSRIQGEPWSNRPRTYERPFSSLFHYHSKLKRAKEALEERWGHCDGCTSPTTKAASPRDLTVDADEAIDDCPTALLVMRAYIDYAEKNLLPLYTQYDDQDCKSNSVVRFTDLWYLFRTGELVFRPLEGSLTMQQNFKTGKRFWKTYCLQPCSMQYRLIPWEQRTYDEEEEERNSFILRAYYLEYNGDEFCVMPKTFAIRPFRGVVPVSSLPVFPPRFAPDWEKCKVDAKITGLKVLEYMERKHASYNGRTATRTPAGELMKDGKGHTIYQSDYINSEIMVDFSEAFQACPAWKPERIVLRPEKAVTKVESDEMAIMWWSDENRSRCVGETSEVIPINTGVGILRQNKFLQTNPLLRRMADNDNRGKLTTVEDLDDEDIYLLTGRVFAYAFQERKFAPLEIQRIQPASETQDIGWLQIRHETKELIQDAVRGHLLQKNGEGQEAQEAQQPRSLDAVAGKGGGLFILLHGMPGVGKTATAEAIAQANGKPLFKITCGDLGLTPDKVETSLKEIFRLAGLWDCILLLDEVDTFFSSRSKGDSAMHKNALVSVFLSIMDYYTGILFLTTNLVGALDEAFKSRIHCTIHYPALSCDQTLGIWRNNIERIQQLDEAQNQTGRQPMVVPRDEILRFARDQFEELNQQRGRGSGRAAAGWNGRQIRNACQLARNLAYADAAKRADSMDEGDRDTVVPRIELRHFRIIHEIVDSFDKYIVAVRSGVTDSDVALQNEARVDHYMDPYSTRVAEEEEGRGGSGSGSGSGSGRREAYADERWRPRHGSGSLGGSLGGRTNAGRQTLVPPAGDAYTGLSPRGERMDYSGQQVSPLDTSGRFNSFPYGRRSVAARRDEGYEVEFGDGPNQFGKRERRDEGL